MDDVNWNLVWLGVALFVLGLIVQAFIEWRRRKALGIVRGEDDDWWEWILKFIIDMMKKRQFGLALSGVGLLVLIAGLGGADFLNGDNGNGNGNNGDGATPTPS